MMKEDRFICCLCGKHVIGAWGNNPWPLNNSPVARCCDECNAHKVIPARLQLIQQNKEK